MLKRCQTALFLLVAISISSPALAQNQGQRQVGQANNGQANNGQGQQQTQQSYSPQVTAQQQAAMQTASDQMLAEAQAKAIQQPTQPFPDLPPEQVEFLGKMLDHWESESQKVNQYVCDFKRYEYDNSVVNYRDPQNQQLAAASIAIGEIRFADPDKGRYETTQIWDFTAPPKDGQQEAEYKRRNKDPNGKATPDREKERWICDGRHLYEFDFDNKRLYETEIPKNMQGSGIIESPIPFLFGANKQQILNRYWVRPMMTASDDEYRLEAFPKRVEDARAYSKIEVYIAKADFLPKAIHVYSPQYDPQKNNFASRYFAFENRRVNAQLSRLKDFLGFFVRPQTPIIGGWKRVNRSALQEQRASLPPGANSTQQK
jgi:TIGR03009 family protein